MVGCNLQYCKSPCCGDEYVQKLVLTNELECVSDTWTWDLTATSHGSVWQRWNKVEGKSTQKFIQNPVYYNACTAIWIPIPNYSSCKIVHGSMDVDGSMHQHVPWFPTHPSIVMIFKIPSLKSQRYKCLYWAESCWWLGLRCIWCKLQQDLISFSYLSEAQCHVWLTGNWLLTFPRLRHKILGGKKMPKWEDSLRETEAQF